MCVARYLMDLVNQYISYSGVVMVRMLFFLPLQT